MNVSEKIAKYLNLYRELNNLWNVRVTVISDVVTLGTTPKDLEKCLEEIRRRIETILTLEDFKDRLEYSELS